MAQKKMAPVRILRDTWDGEGQRHKAGKVIEVETAIAKELITNGVAERADPLPGEAA